MAFPVKCDCTIRVHAHAHLKGKKNIIILFPGSIPSNDDCD